MRRITATVLVAVLASLGLSAGGTSARVSVVLVPIGSFGGPSLNALAAHFRHRLRVDVRVLASIPVPADAYNNSRRQYVGDKLLAQLERAYPHGVVIGITAQDIYMAQQAFRYVFSIRDGRAGVVATARMDPTFYGLPADNELLTSRVEKMTTKDIGALALGRRESSNPRSALYTPILSPADLDFMTEDFAPRPAAADKRAWLAHANTACRTASEQQSALRAIPIPTPADILTVLGKEIDIEKHLLATFETLKAARGDQRLTTKLRATFAGGVSLDQNTLTSLTAQWDTARFQQWARQNAAAYASLTATSLRLGSRPCAAYFGS